MMPMVSIEGMSLLPHIDWNSWLSGLIGAVVGGVIAAVASIWSASRSTKKAFDYSRTLQNEAEREATRRFLLAIRAEVETIWNGYQLEVGHLVEALKPGQGLNLVYKLRQQYFTVYDSNAQYLGHVEDDQLRVAIVRTYTLAKGLVDTHLVNNDLLALHKQMAQVNLGATAPMRAGAQGFINKALTDWQTFGGEVKTTYVQTKESVDLLLRLLNESEALTKE